MQPSPALIGIWNKEGVLIRTKQREEIDRSNSILKTVVILLEKQGKFFLTQPNFSLWPGKWGSSAAGIVQAGETTEQAAQRTMTRELGNSFPLKNLGEAFYDFEGIQRWMSVFYGKVGLEPGSLKNKDAREGKWFSPEEITLLSQMPTLQAAWKKVKESI